MTTATVEIPRAGDCGALEDQAAPTYCMAGDNVLYTCGGCGQWTHFAEGKTVDAAGNVTPSMLCRSCGWHVFGRLMDWSPVCLSA